jgi:hypothetical protein
MTPQRLDRNILGKPRRTPARNNQHTLSRALVRSRSPPIGRYERPRVLPKPAWPTCQRAKSVCSNCRGTGSRDPNAQVTRHFPQFFRRFFVAWFIFFAVVWSGSGAKSIAQGSQRRVAARPAARAGAAVGGRRCAGGGDHLALLLLLPRPHPRRLLLQGPGAPTNCLPVLPCGSSLSSVVR